MQLVGQARRDQRRADRAALLVTPLPNWLALHRAQVPDDLEWLVDFIAADIDFPAAGSRLFEYRKYLQQFDVPVFVDEGLVALWNLYTTAVFPAAPKGQKLCEDCGAPRSRMAKHWCKDCSSKHATLVDPEKARSAAAKRGEKRREDLALADSMRDILAREGLNVTDVAWSQQFMRQNGRYKEDQIH